MVDLQRLAARFKLQQYFIIYNRNHVKYVLNIVECENEYILFYKKAPRPFTQIRIAVAQMNFKLGSTGSAIFLHLETWNLNGNGY